MEIADRQLLPKFLYGALFVAVLPAGLVLWARRTQTIIASDDLPTEIGLVLALAGLVTIAMGMIALWKRGGGLPMNAFPPTRFVDSSIYSLVPHPIYGGFVTLCAGVAIYFGSPSGLWLVTPIVALGSAALVLGYELPDLHQRFGAYLPTTWLPLATVGAPTLLERLRIYPVVILPWVIGYEAVVALGIPSDALSTYFPFERHLPVIEWTEAIYASTYLVVLAVPFLVSTGAALRRFAWQALAATALVLPLFLLLPLTAAPRRFMPISALGDLLVFERSIDSAAAAFPSFHVVWACVAAAALGGSSLKRRWFWSLWAAAVAVSCVTTGMHSIIDVVAGFAAFAIISRLPSIWRTILSAAERLANSWHEWRFGPVRIINHGAYAALATFVGIWIIDTLIGPGRSLVSVSIYIGATVGAALWAQWVEGSPSLLRPLGFYGGMIGAILGALTAIQLGLSLWMVLCAICIAAPWIQAFGRLRCLVQGCCHGRPSEGLPGIRHTHRRSRVVRLSDLAGVTLHPTAVYSILWNVLIGAILLRLMSLHVSASLACGIYLVLSGIGRFVEEAYRGEPQTAIFARLRLYQWIAIACVIAGAVITTITNTRPVPLPVFRGESILVALGCGLMAWFVTGVDFPDSHRRFARLT